MSNGTNYRVFFPFNGKAKASGNNEGAESADGQIFFSLVKR